jgi:methionyl-tRNA synthetase
MHVKPHPYLVTAALPYANGPIHIGHLAGVYIPADIYVRYLRSKKKQVLFISGSDEHGVPIMLRAQQEGKKPQEIADKYHALNKASLENLGISFDIFSRTSTDLHHKTAAEFFTVLHQKGVLEIRESEQYYDEVQQQFLADRYIKGTCPQCSYAEAYGDQCEQCGSTLNPRELLHPRSALSNAKPVLKLTKHWYLPLDQYQAWLEQWILVEHTDWRPNVYGQCKSWLEKGLQPRAVTRDLTWGVPVPLAEAIGKVLYVWFDAPIGYISATKEWAAAHNQDWKDYWQNPDAKLVHFLGKDNIVFHCIIFPVMLKAHNDFILPTKVVANEFLHLEGAKISTSRNHAVWLHEYLVEFPEQQDVLRYVLCSNMPESKDNNFIWEDFQARNNHELVATLGNFVNRSLVLVHKYFQGKVPAKKVPTDFDAALMQAIQQAPETIGQAIEQYRFKEAIQHWIDLARLGNKYLADTAPWHLVKTHPEQVATVLNLVIQLTANIAVLGEPFLPFTSKKLAKMLDLDLAGLSWEHTGHLDLIPVNHVLHTPELLFAMLEDTVIQQQIAKLSK